MMLQKSYDSHVSYIANSAQQAAQDIVTVLDQGVDLSQTIIAVGECHYELSHSFFQINLLKELKNHITFDNSFEFVKDDMYVLDNSKNQIWDASFSSAVKHVHQHCYYPMANCLVPSYVLSKVNSSFICNDLEMDHDEAQTIEGVYARNQAITESILSTQQKNGKPILHVGGHHHLFDQNRPKEATLTDMLGNKKMILVNLIEETDWTDHQRKQTLRSDYYSKNANILADISVSLPASQVMGDSKVFNQWDKIALANNAAEFLLSKKNKSALKRNNFSPEVA